MTKWAKISHIWMVFTISIASVGFIIWFIWMSVSIRESNQAAYQEGKEYFDAGDYDNAIKTLEPLGNYKDSLDIVASARIANDNREAQIIAERENELATKQTTYHQASTLMENGEYIRAHDLFESLGDYEDSIQLAKEASDKAQIQRDQINTYNKAQSLFLSGDYFGALQLFSELGDYENSSQFVQRCRDAARLMYSHSIATGARSSASIISKGTVLFTGYDFPYAHSQLSEWNNTVSIAVGGEYIVGLKSDGTIVYVSKDDTYPVDESNLKNVIDIASGYLHFAVLKEDGTVTAYGSNGYGQCDVESWENVVAISSGDYHTIGLTADGQILYAGYGDIENQPIDGLEVKIRAIEDQLSDIVAFSTGGAGHPNNYITGHFVALKPNGTVLAVGDNSNGQCDVSPENGWTDIVAIAAGLNFTVGLKKDGTVITTPQEDYAAYPMSQWEDIVAISAGTGVTLGLKVDGTVVAAGYNDYGQLLVDSWVGVPARTEWKSWNLQDILEKWQPLR